MNESGLRVANDNLLSQPDIAQNEFVRSDARQGGGGGGGEVPPEIGERVARLEARLDDLPTRKDLASLQGEVAKLGGQLDGLKGQIDGVRGQIDGLKASIASLPTWWQIMGLVGGVLVLSTGLSNADRIIRAWRETPVASAPAAAALPATPPSIAPGASRP